MKHDLDVSTEPILHKKESKTATVYRCKLCGQSWWDHEPTNDCPGVKVYAWQPWPEGLFTAKQIADAGLKPGPVAGVIPREKSPDGWMKLYRKEDATPKRPVTDKQREAIKKSRTCQRCGGHLYDSSEMSAKLCDSCQMILKVERDRQGALKDAYDLICSQDFVVWDSETTDLSGCFVEIAAANPCGRVLFDERIAPQELIAAGALAVHGIPDEALASCPTFCDVYPRLRAALHNQRWVIYNSAFDTGILWTETHRRQYSAWYAAHPIRAREHICAMELCAAYVGDWHGYYNNYRWQKLDHMARLLSINVDLPAHSALGDSLTTLEILYSLADLYRKEFLR